MKEAGRKWCNKTSVELYRDCLKENSKADSF